MSDTKARSIGATIVGVVTLGAGLAAFLVPLQHAGPYGIPGRGLVGGLLCFAISAVLLARGAPALARGVALVASPIVLFFALYGALAEFEEVVVLYSSDAELRLWVVDYDGVLDLDDLPRIEDMAQQLGFETPALLTERAVAEEMLPLEEGDVPAEDSPDS